MSRRASAASRRPPCWRFLRASPPPHREPIADWELKKVKNATRVSFINSADTSLARANLLTQFAVLYGDPNLVNTVPDKVAAVTKEDVRRVAQKYVDLNRLQVVAVGDAAKVARAMSTTPTAGPCPPKNRARINDAGREARGRATLSAGRSPRGVRLWN